MTIWLYCLFGKESLLMPYFLRHYASQVDRLIMLDGNSDDETRRMIRACDNATIRETPYTGGRYDDAEFVRYIEGVCKEARGHADWVLIPDVDEFLWFYGQPIRRSLDNLRATGVRALEFEGYQMVNDEGFPVDDGSLLTDIVTSGFHDRIYNKMLAFDPVLDVRWSVGQHSCAIGGYDPYKFGKLLHYRWFGDEYHAQRNARAHARKSEADLASGRGYHTAPSYNSGKYSAAWFKSMIPQAEKVTDGELLHTR